MAIVTKYELFKKVYDHVIPGSKSIRPAAKGYKDIVYAVLYQDYKDNRGLNVDEEVFKDNVEVKTFVEAYVKESRRRWKSHGSNFVYMMRQCKDFYSELVDVFPSENFSQPNVQEDPVVPPPPPEVPDAQDVMDSEPSTSTTTPRSRKPFSDVSQRQKDRRAEEIRKSVSPSDGHEGLIAATCKDFRSRGLHTVAFILEAIQDDEALAKQVKSYIKALKIDEEEEEDTLDEEPKGLDELSLIAENDMTKQCYKNVRTYVNQKSGMKLLACYDLITACKKFTHPEFEIISDEDAICPMQTLLDHTAAGYMKIPEIMKKLTKLVEEYGPITVEMVGKGGLDGSGDHVMAQQSGSNVGKDTHIMVSIYIPLQLTVNVNGKSEVIYTNPSCNSPVSARVLRLWCRKETPGNFILDALPRFSNLNPKGTGCVS